MTIQVDTTKAREAVDDYCRRYGILPPFEMSKIYELCAENWRNIIPFAGEAGCYLIYGGDGTLLYIGKASLGSTIGARVVSYFRTSPEFGVKHPGAWPTPPRYLLTFKVREPHEAPSLEEFLIRELRPLTNTAGMPRRRPGPPEGSSASVT